MPYYGDLRVWLDVLAERGKLRQIDIPINKDTELHPLVRWQFIGVPEHERTGFLFTNVTGLNQASFAGPVASSVIAPTYDEPNIALGIEHLEKSELPDYIANAANGNEPHVVSSGPVKDEIHKGSAVLEHKGLDEFPIPMAFNGWEILPRITAANVFAKDPETGVLNVGIYNAIRFKQDYTNLRVNPTKQTYTFWQKAKNLGEPLEIAAVIGGPPVIPIVGSMSVPWKTDEMELACGLVDESIPLVECETVDLEVPATAEVVLEGTIPIDRMEYDGPSGEHTGYTLLGREVLGFDITGIMHREDPIWHDMYTGKSPTESSNLEILRKEGPVLDYLRNDCGFEHVKDLAYTSNMGSRHYVLVVQLQRIGGQRPPKNKVWSISNALLANNSRHPKILILVDEDIGIRDMDSVLWAVSFRCQPHRDIKIVQGRKGRDQSVAPLGSGETRFPEPYEMKQGASSMIIDATLNWDYTPVSLPTQEFMERARDIWEDEGFTELTPKIPWYGYSLGEWPDELQELVELANTGAFDEVGERLMEMEQAPWL